MVDMAAVGPKIGWRRRKRRSTESETSSSGIERASRGTIMLSRVDDFCVQIMP